MDQEGHQSVVIKSSNNKFLPINTSSVYNIEMFKLLRQKLDNVSQILKGNQVFQFVFPIFLENVCLSIVTYLTKIRSGKPLNIMNSLVQDFNRYLQTHQVQDLKKIYVTLQMTKSESFYQPFKEQFNFIISLQGLITQDNQKQVQISLGQDNRSFNVRQLTPIGQKIVLLKQLIQMVKKCNVAIVSTQLVAYVHPTVHNALKVNDKNLQQYLNRFLFFNHQRMNKLEMLNQYFNKSLLKQLSDSEARQMAKGKQLCRILDLNICQQYMNAFFLANGNPSLITKVKNAYSFVNMKVALRMSIDQRYWHQQKPQQSFYKQDQSTFIFNTNTTFNQIIISNLPFQALVKFQTMINNGLNSLKTSSDSVKQILLNSMQKVNYDMQSLPKKIAQQFKASVTKISDQLNVLKDKQFDQLNSNVGVVKGMLQDMGNIQSIKIGIRQTLDKFKSQIDSNMKKEQFVGASLIKLQTQSFQNIQKVQNVLVLTKSLLEDMNKRNAEQYMNINQNILGLTPSTMKQIDIKFEQFKNNFTTNNVYSAQLLTDVVTATQNIQKGYQDINSNIKNVSKKLNSIDSKVTKILSLIKQSQQIQLYSSHNNRQINKAILQTEVNRQIQSSQQNISQLIMSMLHQGKSQSEILTHIQIGINDLRNNIVSREDFSRIVDMQTQTLKQFFTSNQIVKNRIDNILHNSVKLTHNKFEDLNVVMQGINTNMQRKLDLTTTQLQIYFNKLYAAQTSLKLQIQNGNQQFLNPLLKLQTYISSMQRQFADRSNNFETIKYKMNQIYESLRSLSQTNQTTFNSYNNSMDRIQQLNLSYIQTNQTNVYKVMQQMSKIQNQNSYITQLTRQGFNSIANFLSHIQSNMRSTNNLNRKEQFNQQKQIYDAVSQLGRKFLIGINNTVDVNLNANKQTNNIILQSHDGIMNYLLKAQQTNGVYQQKLVQQNNNLNQKLKFLTNQSLKYDTMNQKKFDAVNRLINSINTQLSLLNKTNKLALLIPNLKPDFSNVDEIIQNFTFQLNQIDVNSHKSSGIVQNLNQLKHILNLPTSATVMDVSTKIAAMNYNLKYAEEKIADKQKSTKQGQSKIQQLNKQFKKKRNQLEQLKLDYQRLKSKQKEISIDNQKMSAELKKKTRFAMETQQSLQSAKLQKNNFENKLKFQELKSNNLEQQISKLKKEKNKLEVSSEQLSKLKLTHSSELNRIKQLQMKIQQERKNNRVMKLDLDTSTRNLQRQQKKTERLNQTNQQLIIEQNQRKSKLNTLQNQILQIKRTITRVQRQKEDALNKDQASSLKVRQLNDRIKQLENLTQLLNKQKKSIEKLNQQDSKIVKQSLKKCQQQLQKARKQYDIISKENKDLKPIQLVLKQTKALLTQKTNKYQQLSKQLDEAEQKIQSLDKQLKIQKSAIKVLQSNKQELQQKLNKLNSKIQDLNKQSGNMSKQHKKLKKQMVQTLQQLVKKYKKIQNNRNQSSTVLDSHLQVLLDLFNQNNDIMFIERLNNITQSLSSILSNLNSQILSKHQQIMDLTQQNSLYKRQIQKKQQQVLKKQIQMDQLKKEMNQQRNFIRQQHANRLQLERQVSGMKSMKSQLQTLRQRQTQMLENKNRINYLQRQCKQLESRLKSNNILQDSRLQDQQTLMNKLDEIKQLRNQNNRIKNMIKTDQRYKQHLLSIAVTLEIQVSQYQNALDQQRRRIGQGDYIQIQNQDAMANNILNLINQKYKQLMIAYGSMNKPQASFATNASSLNENSMRQQNNLNQLLNQSQNSFSQDFSNVISQGSSIISNKMYQCNSFIKNKISQINQIDKFKGNANYIGMDLNKSMTKSYLQIDHKKIFQSLIRDLCQMIDAIKQTIQQMEKMLDMTNNKKVLSVIKDCITLFANFEEQFIHILRYAQQYVL